MFDIALVDFPWHFNQRFETKGKSRFGPGADVAYNGLYGKGCMQPWEIVDTIPYLVNVMNPQSLIYVWSVPSNMDQFRLVWNRLEEFGYALSTRAFVWVKLNKGAKTCLQTEVQRDVNFSVEEVFSRCTRFGRGAWTASNAEDLWVFSRGGGWLKKRATFERSTVYAPLGERNSRKPSILHSLIERVYPHAKRVELFATTPANASWTCLGWGMSRRDIRVDLCLQKREAVNESTDRRR